MSRSEVVQHGDGGVGRAVLDDDQLEREVAVAEGAHQRLQGLVEEAGLVVGGHHHRQLGRGLGQARACP